MTGIEIRDTQFATWKDPDAWMETMSGPRWKAVLNEENSHVKEIVSKPSVKSRIGIFEAHYRSAKEKIYSIPFEVGPIFVQWNSQFFKTWNYKNSTEEHLARDITVKDSVIWCTEDVGDGAESFELQCWKSGKKVWKKFPVGPEIGVHGKTLYYLGVKNKLIYHELWFCDADTGKNERCIYREKMDTVNLSIEKHSNGRLKLIRDNSQDIEVHEIVSPHMLIKRNEKFSIPNTWVLPIIQSYGIDYVWQHEGIIVMKQHGKLTVWKCKSNVSPVKLLEISAGQILFDPFATWSGTVPTLVSVTRPDTGTNYYMYDGKKMNLITPITPTGLQTLRIRTRSSDGTEVYGILTLSTSTIPDKLLMIGYGAYGMPTSVGSVLSRWAPLVKSGWAIGHTFLRGGGDFTDEWAKAGRLGGRRHTINDFIYLVKKAQSHLQIPPSKTVIYGRSAGGLLVGGTLAKYPTGTLMSGIYAEVPYVDELRTTTNPDLPLTSLEENEFGAPSQRLEDFIQVGMLSPADSSTMLKTPNIFVLTRTAEHDSQVFAYESVKWIRRLRENAGSNSAPKLCIIEHDQGHFTPPDATIKQWALDCSILDAWIHGELQ